MYTRPGMGDGGPCHPRDNIAARLLIDRHKLGYDLFRFNMDSREIQARRLAEFLAQWRKPIVILGKSYKAGVPFTDGSSSLLVAHYLKERGYGPDRFDFTDKNFKEPVTYLLAHPQVYNDHAFIPGSTVVDPWQSCPLKQGLKVIHYGYSYEERASNSSKATRTDGASAGGEIGI